MLTGFDAPPLHTLYLDRPLKGALLMQTLARVNRTFRGKQDGLLVALRAAGREPQPGAGRVHRDRPGDTKPVGRNIDEAVALDRDAASSTLDEVCAGLRLAGQARCAATRSVDQGGDRARPTTCARRRRPATRSPRARRRWPTGSASSPTSSPGPGRCAPAPRRSTTLRPTVAVLRGGPGLDGQVRRPGAAGRRQAGPGGDPAAAVRRSSPTSTATGEVVDIYEAAGMPKPSLSDLGPDFAAKAQQADEPAPGDRGAARPC